MWGGGGEYLEQNRFKKGITGMLGPMGGKKKKQEDHDGPISLT